MNKALGSSVIRQESINENVDIDNLNNIFVSNIEFFKNIIKNSNDRHAKELFNEISKKGIDFPINKHVELFIVKNKNNIEKIIKYLIFRYKFFIAGKKKN